MSFFISSIAADGFRSSPPLSKHTPLPTSVTRGAPARRQRQSISRGARALAAPTAAIKGYSLASVSPLMHDRLAAVLGRQLARRGRQFLGAELIGGCIDQIARPAHRLRSGVRVARVRAGRLDQRIRSRRFGRRRCDSASAGSYRAASRARTASQRAATVASPDDRCRPVAARTAAPRPTATVPRRCGSIRVPARRRRARRWRRAAAAGGAVRRRTPGPGPGGLRRRQRLQQLASSCRRWQATAECPEPGCADHQCLHASKLSESTRQIDNYLIVVLISGVRHQHMNPTMQTSSSLVLLVDLLLLKSSRGGCCRRF